MKAGAKLELGRQAALGAFTFVILAAAATNNANSADANSKFSVRGLGTHTCTDYLKDSSEEGKNTAQYADWLTGFFTAYNWLKPDTYDIAPLSQYKQSGLLSFLELYCGKNPEKRVIDAAMALVKATYDKRDKTHP
jgi:hypothetical protein